MTEEVWLEKKEGMRHRATAYLPDASADARSLGATSEHSSLCCCCLLVGLSRLLAHLHGSLDRLASGLVEAWVTAGLWSAMEGCHGRTRGTGGIRWARGGRHGTTGGLRRPYGPAGGSGRFWLDYHEYERRGWRSCYEKRSRNGRRGLYSTAF